MLGMAKVRMEESGVEIPREKRTVFGNFGIMTKPKELSISPGDSGLAVGMLSLKTSSHQKYTCYGLPLKSLKRPQSFKQGRSISYVKPTSAMCYAIKVQLYPIFLPCAPPTLNP